MVKNFGSMFLSGGGVTARLTILLMRVPGKACKRKTSAADSQPRTQFIGPSALPLHCSTESGRNAGRTTWLPQSCLCERASGVLRTNHTSLNNGGVDAKLKSQSLHHSIATTQLLLAHRCTRPSDLLLKGCETEPRRQDDNCRKGCYPHCHLYDPSVLSERTKVANNQ